MLYRTAGLIDGAVHGSHAPDAVLSALEEFAIEASALKVASSEMLDYVVDENVQIHVRPAVQLDRKSTRLNSSH